MGLWWINHDGMCQLKTKARVFGNFLEGHQLVALVGIPVTFFLPFLMLWFLHQWVAAKQVMLLRTEAGTGNALFLFKINNSKLQDSLGEKSGTTETVRGHCVYNKQPDESQFSWKSLSFAPLFI